MDWHSSNGSSRLTDTARERTFAGSAAHEQAAGMLILAAWFGLLTGLIEVLLLAAKKYWLGQAIFLGPHVAWMAPLATLLVFAVLGLALTLAALRRPQLISQRIAIPVLAFFAWWSWLLLFPRVQFYASLLLAAGLAFQSGRWLRPRAAGFQALAHRTAAWMLALVLLLAAGVTGWQWLGERRALAKLPPLAPDAPNVLLIVLDTVGAEYLSLYGYHRRTSPQLERFAQTGVRFDWALSTAPWTTPAHAGLFTGRFPHELSVDWDIPLDGAHPTLAEVLRARGYLTAGFIANSFACGYESGLGRGFLRYDDYPVSVEELLLSSSLLRAALHAPALRRAVGNHQVFARRSAEEINRAFLAWQERQRRPFFAFLNYFDAHEPYLPPAPFNTQFGSPPARADIPVRHDLRMSFRHDREQIPPHENLLELNAYEGVLAYLDHHLGRLFDELKRRGALDNTLVIVTADHGEAFGEHGHFAHGDNLYLTLLRVPLLISFPARVPAGQSVAEPVSLRNLPATVLALLRLDGTPTFPGHSLARHWNGTLAPDAATDHCVLSQVNLAPLKPERFAPGTRADMASLVLDRYHYIRNADGREELYDFKTAPQEQDDLALDEQHRPALELLRKSLEAELKGTK
jgi:arylsulfatase A-like enzyme